MNTSDETLLAMLKKAKALDTQVAGHAFNEDKKQYGMLDLQNGIVLKEVQDPPRGTREMEFYETVFDPACTNPDIITLRQFLCPFHGVLETNGTKFMKLSNVTWNFINPSVLDIKIGKKTFDPEASEEKKAKEMAKFPPAQTFGYQFVGMMVHDLEKESKEKVPKEDLRAITEERILEDGLGRFFGLGTSDFRRQEIMLVLHSLKRLAQWFEQQRCFVFYASSLLLVYETSPKLASFPVATSHTNNPTLAVTSDTEIDRCVACIKPPDSACFSSSSLSGQEIPHRNISSCNPSHAICGQVPHVEVRMIDFAHVFPSNEQDDNYLFGLQNLIQHLCQLLDK